MSKLLICITFVVAMGISFACGSGVTFGVMRMGGEQGNKLIAGRGISGRFVKVEGDIGWKTLEFKSSGTMLINNGEFASTYRVEDGLVIMKAGITEATGEMSGETLRIGKSVFRREK